MWTRIFRFISACAFEWMNEWMNLNEWMNEAEEWPQEAEWKLPMEDFHKHEPAEFHRCRELTHILCQDSPKIFPRRTDWATIHQCKQKPGEATFFWVVWENFQWALQNGPEEFSKPSKWCFPGGSVVKNHLPMQEAQIRSLAWEDLTCRGATKPASYNYWACGLEPGSPIYWAHMPHLLKPECPRASTPQPEKPPRWEATAPRHLESSPYSLQREKSPHSSKTQSS